MPQSKDGGELVPPHLEERPEFTTVTLVIDVQEALDVIEDTVRGLTSADTDEGVRLRTRDGMLVAVVSEGPGDDADVGSVVASRTAPPSELATRKAGKIRDAIDEQPQ